MALRVFACARGRTRSFHAVCLEKGMRGAGRACIGVWEFGVCPEGVMVPEGRSLHVEVSLFKKKRCALGDGVLHNRTQLGHSPGQRKKLRERAIT